MRKKEQRFLVSFTLWTDADEQSERTHEFCTLEDANRYYYGRIRDTRVKCVKMQYNVIEYLGDDCHIFKDSTYRTIVFDKLAEKPFEYYSNLTKNAL